MPSTSLLISALKKHHSVTIIATGNSMKPFIDNGTKIIIQPRNFSAIKLYDVVAVNHNNQLVIHQCIFKNFKYLVCKGTNNTFIDPPSFPRQILGTVEISNHWQVTNIIYDLELQQLHHLIPNIPILILKGATWQKHFFGYYLNKTSSDIDILIKRSDFPQIKKILQKLHYQPAAHIYTVCETTYYKMINSQKFSIDIHFQAVRSALNPIFRYPIDSSKMDNLTAEFWRSSYQISKIHFLKNEYLLFYNCLNSVFHHGVRGTDILAQIATIINKQKINWTFFWQLADKYQMSNFIYYPLGWSARLFKIKVPNLYLHRPSIFRRTLAKLLINNFTVFRPFNNLGKSQLSSQLNTKLITLLRMILYQP